MATSAVTTWVGAVGSGALEGAVDHGLAVVVVVVSDCSPAGTRTIRSGATDGMAAG